MKPLRSFLRPILTVLLAAILSVAAAHASGQDKSGDPRPLDWPEPATVNRPGCYWWWPGSAVDRDNITWNLETLHAAGLGGASIVPIYGVKGCEDRFIPYLSPEWLAMLDHAVREAARLGMWVDMTTGTGWPFGGPSVAANDADAVVVYENGKLSRKFSGRKVKRAAPGGEGFAVNPYSKHALEDYLEIFDRAFAAFDAASGAALPRAQYHDSFEYRGNWCDGFLGEFEARRGYDLSDHLPELFGTGDPDVVARVKCDYRETLSDLHLRFIETWAAWAGARGCTTRNQAHGAPANLLDVYAAGGIPETETFGATPFAIPGLRRRADNVRGDRPQPLINRMASSAAHVAGRPLTASETCTWVRNHFRAALSQVKPEIDRLFLCGINHVFYHGCCYSPRDAEWPGWLFYASLEANPRNAIWRDIPELNGYVTRCQSILQAGAPDNDVLLYWPVHDVWHSAEGMQQQFTVHDARWLAGTACGRTAQRLIDCGYAFDFVSDRQILESESGADAAAGAGAVTATDSPTGARARTPVKTRGAAYRAILVPETTRMPLATLSKLLALARTGAAVVFMDALPVDVPGFAALEERRAELKRLAAGAGGLVAKDFDAARRRLDAAGTAREPLVDHGVDFIRRVHGNGRHYFIANLGAANVDAWIPLGTPALSAAVMDPRSARTGVAPFRTRGRAAEILVQLQPGETRIIRTFEKRRIEGEPWPVLRPGGKPHVLAGEWRVDFIEGGPVLPASFMTAELRSWTELGGTEAVRFAGAARYRLEFELPGAQAMDWVLDLGDVRESACVFINGRRAGALWSIPFRMPVGRYLHPGTNVLEVEVTNLSANRIRDLDIRKVEWKIFHDVNFVDHNYKPFDASGWDLTESGLLGPVTLTPMSDRGREGDVLNGVNQTVPPVDIATGREIPSEGYCDQPYVVKLADGTWLCTMTTGRGREGEGGQHVVSTRSSDQGRTWGELVDIEPADGPEASWVMPLVTPRGRIYAFYTYNAADLRTVTGGGKRVDTLGEYALKYSDDGGRTWSDERWFIPVRETDIDRRNPYEGAVRFFWGVGKPIVHDGAVYLGFSKVGRFGEGFIAESEAWFLRSDNILVDDDPAKIRWQTLPTGERGLRSPEGPIAEEANLTVLSDGSLFCTYRTVAGHPCHAYSRDEGRTWTAPEFMTYEPGGERLKHPRAANFVRRLDEGPFAGRYIYWFHNHGGRGYQGRNPAWLLGGKEKDSPGGKVIAWGRPVAILYSEDPAVRISYPDFIWDDGRLFITETQKSIARVHEVPGELLESLWDN